MANSRQTFHSFLLLPAELRLQIYEHILALEPRYIYHRPGGRVKEHVQLHCEREEPLHYPPVSPLLHTSKEARAFGLPRYILWTDPDYSTEKDDPTTFFPEALYFNPVIDTYVLSDEAVNFNHDLLAGVAAEDICYDGTPATLVPHVQRLIVYFDDLDFFESLIVAHENGPFYQYLARFTALRSVMMVRYISDYHVHTGMDFEGGLYPERRDDEWHAHNWHMTDRLKVYLEIVSGRSIDISWRKVGICYL